MPALAGGLPALELVQRLVGEYASFHPTQASEPPTPLSVGAHSAGVRRTPAGPPPLRQAIEPPARAEAVLEWVQAYGDLPLRSPGLGALAGVSAVCLGFPVADHMLGPFLCKIRRRRSCEKRLIALAGPPRWHENEAVASLTSALLGATEPVEKCDAGASGTPNCSLYSTLQNG